MGFKVVTFDIDWAPDWAIELCAEICRSAGAAATFFVTHASDILNDLRRRPDIELGIHPNLLSGSSHGCEHRAVLDHCMALVPEARSMRTHSLVQSSPFFHTVASHSPITTDVSLLLPFHDHLRPTNVFTGSPRRRILRLPYFWEDDVAAEWPGWEWDSGPVQASGLQIYDFHPIHVALNMERMSRYSALREGTRGRAFPSLTRQDVERFANPGEGTRTYLERLLSCGDAGEFRTVSQIASCE